MGIYTDALEEAGRRLRRESLFLFKTIIIDGEKYEPLVCEKRMLRILEFKGTGKKMKFYDIYKLVKELSLRELERAWEKGDINPTPWIDEYIIQNNIQVVFEKDDVRLNPARVKKV